MPRNKGVNRNIGHFVQRSMVQWKTKLLVNGDKLGKVNMKRMVWLAENEEHLISELMPKIDPDLGQLGGGEHSPVGIWRLVVICSHF